MVIIFLFTMTSTLVTAIYHHFYSLSSSFIFIFLQLFFFCPLSSLLSSFILLHSLSSSFTIFILTMIVLRLRAFQKYMTLGYSECSNTVLPLKHPLLVIRGVQGVRDIPCQIHWQPNYEALYFAKSLESYQIHSNKIHG